MRVRQFLLALTAFGAAACGSDPDDSANVPAPIPTRSALPDAPTPVATTTPVPPPTPIPTRGAVVELFDFRGAPIPNVYVYSSIGDTIVDLSLTDGMGTTALNVVDDGYVTAVSTAFDRPTSITIDTPTGPLIKIRSATYWGIHPVQTIQVTGAAPGSEVNAAVASAPRWSGTMPADGGPLYIDVGTTDRSYLPNGRYAAYAYTGPYGAPTRWGAVVDVPSGQPAQIALRTTNESPILSIQEENAGGCVNRSVFSAFQRDGLTIGHSLLATFQTNGTATVQPWGSDLADRFYMVAHCQKSTGASAASHYLLRYRPFPGQSPSVDYAPRTSHVTYVTALRTAEGRPSVSWTNTAPFSTDVIGGLVVWSNETGGRSWEFRLRPRAEGAYTFIHPPLPIVLAGILDGEFLRANVHAVDAAHIDGYGEAWKLFAWPQPESSDYYVSASYAWASPVFLPPF